MEPSLKVDKLRYEIFSILENKLLFGACDDPKLFPASGSPRSTTPKAFATGKVRILSIDGGGAASDGLLAGFALARLEAFLRKISGDPAARIAEFFDLAAGSGAGGILAAMLFTRGPDGRPLFPADEAHRLLTKNRSQLATCSKKGYLRKIFSRSRGGSEVFFRRIFGDATLRDTVKPVLIPCYDLASGAPFVFSRVDAVETDGYDFLMREVCAATCTAVGVPAVEMRSVDGRTKIRAIGGELAMSNPTASAITHVLNNKLEFPFAAGVEDLLVLSLGTGEPEPAGRTQKPPSAADFVRIAGMGQADVVDQAVGMSFGKKRTTNYIRIQGNGVSLERAVDGMEAAEEMLAERNVESVLFQGRKLTEGTNGEKLQWITEQLIREHEWRKGSRVPTVLIKPTMMPRTSFSTSVTTVSSTTSSDSL